MLILVDSFESLPCGRSDHLPAFKGNDLGKYAADFSVEAGPGRHQRLFPAHSS